MFDRLGQQPETVDHFYLQFAQFVLVGSAGNTFVKNQAAVHIVQVIVGYQRRQVQVYFRPVVQGTFQLRLTAGPQGGDGTLQQFGIQAEANLMDLAALVVAKQLARTTDFQVVGSQCETGTQVFKRLDGFDSFNGVVAHCLARRYDHIGIGTVVRTSDPAAQLM